MALLQVSIASGYSNCSSCFLHASLRTSLFSAAQQRTVETMKETKTMAATKFFLFTTSPSFIRSVFSTEGDNIDFLSQTRFILVFDIFPKTSYPKKTGLHIQQTRSIFKKPIEFTVQIILFQRASQAQWLLKSTVPLSRISPLWQQPDALLIRLC